MNIAKELRKADTIVELYYGSKTIPVKVYFESRKRLSITVHPDMRVIAKAPSDQSIEKITKFLNKRTSRAFELSSVSGNSI